MASFGGAKGRKDSKTKTRRILAGPVKAETPLPVVEDLRGSAVQSPQEGWTLSDGTPNLDPTCSAKLDDGSHPPSRRTWAWRERRYEIRMMD